MKKIRVTMIVIFVAFLALVSGGSLLMKDREFSPNENRYLAEPPRLTVDNILSGKFQDSLENYLRDQICFRDGWITVKTGIQKACKDTDIGGAYVGKDGYDFEKITPEDVDETIDVVKRVQYDNAFTFIYSKRTGTPAAAMEQVPEETVKEGFDRLLKVVQDTARERVELLQGQTLEALVEGVNEQDDSLLTGRLSNNTIVHFKGEKELIGKIIPVYLKECHGFYYLGELV